MKVSVNGLCAGYGGRDVLKDIRFDISGGEVLTVAGPNGAGKSTLLRCMAGLLKPSAGQILVGGKELSAMRDQERARKIAVMFTDRVRREPETCFRTAAQGRYPYTGWLGKLSADDEKIVEDAMEATDCLQYRDREYGELSDGQKQRVLLARAIAQQPDLLLLDEPATYLDFRYQLELMHLLRKLAKDPSSPLTVVMSLHDIQLAGRFSDRILMLKDGRQFAEGSPEELLETDRVAALFEIDKSLLEDFLGRGQISPRPAADGKSPAPAAGGKSRNFGGSGYQQDTEESGKEQSPDDLETVNKKARKGMRKGFTTGTSAALASQGAAVLLLAGLAPDRLSVMTPAGIRVSIRPADIRSTGPDEAQCTVIKSGGDDADATDGIRITARVRLVKEPGVSIDGGDGVGRVTREGLDQPVGQAAINHVPRQMIRDVLQDLADQYHYPGGFQVLICAMQGKEISEKTLNGMLGIVGGISILGTSGIVEPMSEQALVETIRTCIHQQAATGHDNLILTPGNYGKDYLQKTGLDALGIPVVQMSNYVGDALDIAGQEGIRKVLLVGHTGKLVKLAASVMNTHSRYADGRAEVFIAYAALAGAPQECLQKLFSCVTSDAAVDVLKEYQVFPPARDRILAQIQKNLDKRTKGLPEAGAVLFSAVHGLFGVTGKGRKLLSDFGFQGNL